MSRSTFADSARLLLITALRATNPPAVDPMFGAAPALRVTHVRWAMAFWPD